MSNGARQFAVALIASLRSPPALRISNQLTMATGETTIKSHVLKRGGGAYMQTMMAMTITAAAIWRREGWRREVWGVRERKGGGRQLRGDWVRHI